MGDGHPQVPLSWKIEAIRHHANDGGGRTVDLDGKARDIRAFAKLAGPKAVVEDCHRRRSRGFIRRHKIPPQHWPHAQQPEQVCAHIEREGVGGASLSLTQRNQAVRHKRHTLKRMRLRAPILKIPIRDATSA